MSNQNTKNTPRNSHIIFSSTNFTSNTIDRIPPFPLDNKTISLNNNKNPLYKSHIIKNDTLNYGYFSPGREIIEIIPPSDNQKSYSPHPARPKINVFSKNIHTSARENLAYSKMEKTSLNLEKEPKDHVRNEILSENFESMNNNVKYLRYKKPLDNINNQITFINEFFEKKPRNLIEIFYRENNVRKTTKPLNFIEKINTSSQNAIKKSIKLNNTMKSNYNINNNKINYIQKKENFRNNINKDKNMKNYKFIKEGPTDNIRSSVRNKTYNEKGPLDSIKIDLNNISENIGNIVMKKQKEIKLKNSLNINDNLFKKNNLLNGGKKFIVKTIKKISQDNVKFLNKSEIKIVKFVPLNINVSNISNVDNKKVINKEQIKNILTLKKKSNNKIENAIKINSKKADNNKLSEERKDSNYNGNKIINVNIKINDKNNIYKDDKNLNEGKDMIKVEQIKKVNMSSNGADPKKNHLAKSQQVKSVKISENDMNKLNKNLIKINNNEFKKNADEEKKFNKENNIKEEKTNVKKTKDEKLEKIIVNDEDTKNKASNENNKGISAKREMLYKEKEKIIEKNTDIPNLKSKIAIKSDKIINANKINNNIEINLAKIKEIKKEEKNYKEKMVFNEKDIIMNNNLDNKLDLSSSNNIINKDNNKILEENNSKNNEGNNNHENLQKDKVREKADILDENIQENIVNENINNILKGNKIDVNANNQSENNAQKIIVNNYKILQKNSKKKELIINATENEDITKEKIQNKANTEYNIKTKLGNKGGIKNINSENNNIIEKEADRTKKIIESETSDIKPKENNNSINLDTNIIKKPKISKIICKEELKKDKNLKINKKEKGKSLNKTNQKNKLIQKNLNSINAITETNNINNTNNSYSDKKEPNITPENKNLLVKSVQQSHFNKIKELFKNEDEKPDSLNPNGFIYISIIGEGEFGKIYLTQKKSDSQFYAMKIEILKSIEEVKKSQMITKIIKDFLQKTNSKGVIKIYGDICLKNNNLYNYYVLMERAVRDMEQELIIRCNTNQFYCEKDITNVLCQLLLTLAEMQRNHIAHRDIKPQNILIINGLYKLSDFGEAIVFKNNEDEGSLLLSVSGTELYMSPIVFFAMKNKCERIKHNVYKSDVFSLGLCILLGATLNYDSLCQIRELTDMNEIQNVLMYYLSGRYSNTFIFFLLKMLEVDESKRPDFIQLENMLVKRK